VGSRAKFSYTSRHRWAYLPTIAFFLFLLLALWLKPDLLWGGEVDPRTRNAGMLLSGTAVILLAGAFLRRIWTEPHIVEFEPDAMVLQPIVGQPRRVAYTEIESAAERKRPALRGAVELELRTNRRQRIVIRGEISDYPRLRRLLLERLPVGTRDRWTGPEDS
jgi:hypothetical protein